MGVCIAMIPPPKPSDENPPGAGHQTAGDWNYLVQPGEPFVPDDYYVYIWYEKHIETYVEYVNDSR